MSSRLMRQRQVRLGALQFTVSIDERLAQRLRRNPAVRRVLGRNNGRNGSSRAPTPSKTSAAVLLETPSPEAEAIARSLPSIDWYHVMDLPHGLVTPGRADHRAEVAEYGVPEDMRGMRALDVATFDGFWAFEMERRGAEVTAIDIPSWGHLDLPLRWREGMKPEQDVPTGDGFRLAAKLLGSRVLRRELSVYDLSPTEVGQFDVVIISDLLQHLRDPQRALERVYKVIKPGGMLLLAEEYSPELEPFADLALMEFRSYASYTWWIPSTAALSVMLRVAGFQYAEELSRFDLKYDGACESPKIVLRARR